MRILRSLKISFLLILLSTPAFAGLNNVVEADGSPSTFPWKLIVSNGTLTDNGDGTATLTIGSGVTVGNAVTGGAANQVLYEDASQNLASSANLFFDGTNLRVGGTGGVTESAAAGVLTIGGTGNTNNEKLTLDFETNSNQVTIDSTTGVTTLNFAQRVTSTRAVDNQGNIFINTSAASGTGVSEGFDSFVNTASTTASNGAAGGIFEGSRSGSVGGNAGVTFGIKGIGTYKSTGTQVDAYGVWGLVKKSVSASGIISDAYSLYGDLPTASGGGTITRGWSAGFNGAVKHFSNTLFGTAVAGAHEYNGNHYLTNSSIRFPVGGTLFDHYADVTSSGTGETDLYTDTLAASTLANNGDKILAIYAVNTGFNVNSQTVRVYFGGTKIFDSGGTSATASAIYNVTVIRDSSSSVRCAVTEVDTGLTALAAATITKVTGLTLSNTQIIKVTGQEGGSGGSDMTAIMGTVSFQPAA